MGRSLLSKMAVDGVRRWTFYYFKNSLKGQNGKNRNSKPSIQNLTAIWMGEKCENSNENCSINLSKMAQNFMHPTLMFKLRLTL